MASTYVAVGSSPIPLATSLAKILNAEALISNVRRFPDGESKITLPSIPEGHCIVVQSTHPPVDTGMMHAIMLIQKVAQTSDRVTVVVPYMGYARQDQEFLNGEIVTLRVVVNILMAAGADRIITVDIHSATGLGYSNNISSVSAMPELARHFGTINLNNPLVVSPDRGGMRRAEAFADSLGIQAITLDKKRDRVTGEVSVSTGMVNVNGNDIILVDDIISTGGSIIEATKFLKEHGCGDVFAACTHGLLINEAAKKLHKVGVRQIVSTNTIPGETAAVDVAGVISDAI